MTMQDLGLDTAEVLASIAETTHFWQSFDADALESLTSPQLDQLGDATPVQAA